MLNDLEIVARPDGSSSHQLLELLEALNDDLAEYSQLFEPHPEP
jgi:hypothetical protein